MADSMTMTNELFDALRQQSYDTLVEIAELRPGTLPSIGLTFAERAKGFLLDHSLAPAKHAEELVGEVRELIAGNGSRERLQKLIQEVETSLDHYYLPIRYHAIATISLAEMIGNSGQDELSVLAALGILDYYAAYVVQTLTGDASLSVLLNEVQWQLTYIQKVLSSCYQRPFSAEGRLRNSLLAS